MLLKDILINLEDAQKINTDLIGDTTALFELIKVMGDNGLTAFKAEQYTENELRDTYNQLSALLLSAELIARGVAEQATDLFDLFNDLLTSEVHDDLHNKRV